VFESAIGFWCLHRTGTELGTWISVFYQPKLKTRCRIFLILKGVLVIWNQVLYILWPKVKALEENS
jgi:hypothetical protein